MIKRCLFFLTVLVLSAQAAEQNDFSNQWLAFYFRDPQPARFVEEVRALGSTGAFSRESSKPPLITFLGRVMAQNPGKIEGWMKELDNLPQEQKDVLYAALWFSGTTEGKQSLEARGIKDYAGKKAPAILTMEIDSPVVINMLWAWYFATSDEAAVRRVVSAFDLSAHEGAAERFKSSQKTARDRRAAYQDIAFKAAQASLADNCGRYPEVLRLCDKFYGGDTLNKTENLWLGMILSKAAPAKYKIEPGSTQWTENGKPVASKPNMNLANGFGVMLCLTDNPAVIDGRGGQGTANLTMLTKAHRGVPINAVLLLSGPGLDASGAADVVFDIVIHKPDGTIFAETKDAVCWKGKYDVSARSLQLSKGRMAFQINPGDLPGIYSVDVMVRDRVKNVELPVRATFEVP